MSERTATPQRPSGPPEPKEVFSFAQIQHLLRVEFSRAQRYSYPLVALEIAVDRLGHLRDVFGYDLKEDVLRRVIELLAQETRGSDLLGRMPDDRLLLVVPHVPPEQAQVLGKRLLKAAAKLSFVHEQHAIEVTLSVGASWTVAGETLFFDALLDATRAALSEAVAGGGDRYVGRAPGEHPIP